MGHLPLSTGRLSPKMVPAHTQVLQGLVLPEDTDREGRDPASLPDGQDSLSMLVVHSLQRLWQPASGDRYIYIAICLRDGGGGIPSCLLAIRVGAVKKYWLHNCIWPPQWQRL